MATIKVLKRFWDRKKKVTRLPNESFVDTDERAAEIKRRLPDYVDIVVDAVSHPERDDSTISADSPRYSEMSSQELRALCVERGLDVPKRAKKAQLVALLEG